MRKFKSVLSDVEITNIVFPCDWSGNKDQQMACIIAREVEQATLAKLHEQEPVVYRFLPPSAQQYMYITDDAPKIKEFEPLYAHPPMLTDHIPDAGKMIEHESHSLEFEVRTMVEMLEAKEWAEHCGKSDLGQRLEWAITSLHNEAQIIPDGWQLVPKEPSQEMTQAADDSDREYSERSFGGGIHLAQSGYDHYIVMLAAAPKYTGENVDD